jgi:DNA-binding phage protein
MPSVPHDDLMRKYLAEPEEALAYLNVVLEDGHPGLIAHALNLIMELHGLQAGTMDALRANRIKRELALYRTPARLHAKRAIPRAAPKARRAPAKRTRKVAA